MFQNQSKRFSSLNILQEFKPDIVLGFGGYVTYPVIMAASKLKIKTFIHEQNSIPGKSNKMLAHYADIIGVSFLESTKYFSNKNVIYTGNPCSENAYSIKKSSKTEYGLHKGKKSILCVQGSLGSKVVNDKMLEFLKDIDDEKYEVLYITGNSYYESFKKNKLSKNVYLTNFVNPLCALMKDFDLVITRAGASIISEIVAIGIPAIFIPSPYVANNHQYYNALNLKQNHAGLMIEEKDLNKNKLKETINMIFDNELYAQDLKVNAQKLCVKNSATKIYEEIKKIL